MQLSFSVRYRTPPAYFQPWFVKDPSPSAGKSLGWNPRDDTHLGRTGGWESGWLLLWRMLGSMWRRNGNGTPSKAEFTSWDDSIPPPKKKILRIYAYILLMADQCGSLPKGSIEIVKDYKIINTCQWFRINYYPQLISPLISRILAINSMITEV